MTSQLDLILSPAVARISDPSSSKSAAFEQTASGRQKRHAEQVLALVRAYPGSTYRELHSQQSSLDPAEVQRRLQDLAKDDPERGIVPRVTRSTDQRTCRVSKRPAQTWTAVQAAQESAA